MSNTSGGDQGHLVQQLLPQTIFFISAKTNTKLIYLKLNNLLTE